VSERKIDLNEIRRRVRRRGLLGALVEGPSRPVPPAAPEAPASPPLPPALGGDPVPPPPPEPSPLIEEPVEPEAQETVEFEADPEVADKLSGCRISCAAVITGIADLPALELGPEVLEVALLRLRVHRPEGDAECCVRQHIPVEIRSVIGPGAGVMVLAHENDLSVAAVDWVATGDRIGTRLSFPSAREQYDWPPRPDWPAIGMVEIHDVDGHGEMLEERRGEWSLGSAGLVSLTPLRSRLDQRDEWQVGLQLQDGQTIEVRDRVPVLALARLRPGEEARVGTPIDVLVSKQGEVAVDWEATLRQPELRSLR
jgi:hypothetical protein